MSNPITGAKPTYVKGINITPDYPGYGSPYTDFGWAKPLGLDHVAIVQDIEKGSAGISEAMGTIEAVRKAKVQAVLRPFYSGKNWNDVFNWWKHVGNIIPTRLSGVRLSVLNEPIFTLPDGTVRWTSEGWINNIQPEIVQLMQKQLPFNEIVMNPGGISSWEAFQDSQGGKMWLPADTSRILVEWHAYTVAQDGTWDTYSQSVIDVLTNFAKNRKVRLYVGEYGGGEEPTTSWYTLLNRVATRNKIFTGMGIGSAYWHWSRLLLKDGSVRPDLLLAIREASYVNPMNASIATLAPHSLDFIGTSLLPSLTDLSNPQ